MALFDIRFMQAIKRLFGSISQTLHPAPRLLFIAGFGVLLLSCSSSPEASSPSDTLQPNMQQVSQSNRGQMLPVSATASVGDQSIQLEVASTPRQQEIGLMYRTELADDRGMLFAFEPPRPVQFWMRNTLIPLDMVFMLDGEVKAIAANAAPCTTATCPLYGSRASVNQVIELRGGRAAELGLQVGDRVAIEFLETGAGSAARPSP